MKKIKFLLLGLTLFLGICFTGCKGNLSENEQIELVAGTTYSLENTDGSFGSSNESVAYFENGLIYGVSAGSAEITQTNGKTVIKYSVNVTEGTVKTLDNFSDKLVGNFGRNEVIDGKLNLYHSAASFEIGFVGTSISIDVSAAFLGASECYISILTDNEDDYSKNVQSIMKNETIELKLKTNKYHRIRIYKRNEAKHTTLTINSCTTDGYLTFGKKKPSRKIEIYGDSISAGYTVLGEPFSMRTENALDTYGVVAADNLKAQVNVFAYTGIGLSASGNYSAFMKDIFKQYSSERTKRWDFNSYIPDAVILNLGTNDVMAINYDEETFKTDYTKMIKDLRSFYPTTEFVCISGMMTPDLDAVIEKMVENIKKTDQKVSHLILPGSGGAHPSLVQHKSAGEMLTVHLQEVLNW